MVRKAANALLLAALLLPAGCERPSDTVRIGSKPFAENRLTAEIFAQLLEAHDIPVERRIPYGNTFDLQQAIKAGDIDLYPEYTGTGLSMMGIDPVGGREEAMQLAQEVFEPFDLVWLPRLGFENAYAVVILPDKAAEWDVSTIADLAAREETLRFGCDQEFLARPVDGYQPLIRRYGFSPEPTVITHESREDLYRALLTDEVDAIAAHTTDPQIDEFGLVILEDNASFFPAYDAVPLLRKSIAERRPEVAAALKELQQRISIGEMRTLVRRTELDGEEAADVAAEFLLAEKLIVEAPPRPELDALTVATLPMGYRPAAIGRALIAVRTAFPGRRVRMIRAESPADALVEGRAFLAIVGAEHFFQVRPGRLPTPRSGMEAIAPVGHRVVHLVRREPSDSSNPFKRVARLGVGLPKGSSEEVARMLLEAYSQTKSVSTVTGDLLEQFADVNQGRLDGVLIIATPGDAELMELMREYRDLTLQPIGAWKRRSRQYRYPFLRVASIPKGTYAGQETQIETVGAQLVLAGPSLDEQLLSGGGPAAGLQVQRQPIPRSYKVKLTDAIGIKEALDPALPGERVGLATARQEVLPVNPAPLVSVGTAVLLLALAGFFFLLSRAPEPGQS